MTDTITEQTTFGSGDHVQYRTNVTEQWRDGVVAQDSILCGCHRDVVGDGGIRYRVEWSNIQPAIPTADEDNSVPLLSLRIERASGINRGERVVPTLLSGRGNGLTMQDWSPEREWFFNRRDATDHYRTFLITRDDGVNFWVADIARFEDVSPYAPEPLLPVLQVGDRVVVESNIIPNGDEGILGDGVIGMTGDVSEVGTNANGDEYVEVQMDEDTQSLVTDLVLHPVALLPISDLDELARLRSHGGNDFEVGDEVTFTFDGARTSGTVIEWTSPQEGQVAVQTGDHGVLYPYTTALTPVVPNPMEWARSLVEGDEGYEQAQELLAQIRTVESRLAEAEERKAEFLDQVQHVASTTANDERWCEVADGGLAKFGLERTRPPRREDVGWSAHVDFRIEHSVEDRDAEDLIANHYGVDTDEVEIPGYTTIVAEVSITVRGTIEADEDECVCDSVGPDEIRSQLSSELEDETFTIEEINCDNH